MLRRTSLGTLGLSIGGLLTIVGFWAFFIADNATLNLVGFFYGIPLLLGGLALKASELEPVPFIQPTTADVLTLREQQATASQNQIRNDVTRYRYGQRAHLDSSLSRLGLSPTDEECPVLVGVQEANTEGAYTLMLEFESPLIPFDVWQEKQDKLASFFGPGVKATVSQADEQRVDVALIALPNEKHEA